MCQYIREKSVIVSSTLALLVWMSIGGGILSGCSSTASSVRHGEEIEGWRIEGDRDVFYMRRAGRASENAIGKDDMGMMKTTCVESAQLQASDRVIRKMLGDYIQSASETVDGQTQNYIVQSVRSGIVRDVSIKECAPTDKDHRWSSCECIMYVQGKNLRKDFEFQVENLLSEHK